MCTTIEVGAGGIELLISNGLLGPHEKNNKAAIQRAVEDALPCRYISNDQTVIGTTRTQRARRRCLPIAVEPSG
jgi:hypothetical protein